MINFDAFGKFFIFLGLLFLAIGIFFVFIKQIPFFGKLPGDILIQKKNFTFYFPVTTSIILSILLSIVLYFISKR
ncbi:MAG: DUF2905 domain-containing protein [bacterium]